MDSFSIKYELRSYLDFDHIKGQDHLDSFQIVSLA